MGENTFVYCVARIAIHKRGPTKYRMVLTCQWKGAEKAAVEKGKTHITVVPALGTWPSCGMQ